MVHIMRINENISRDYAMSVLENILDSDDFSVEIVDCSSGKMYPRKGFDSVYRSFPEIREGKMFEYLSEFITKVRSMAETCNGELHIGTGSNMTYNVVVTDENGDDYASISFRLVYYRDDSVETLQAKFDNFEY